MVPPGPFAVFFLILADQVQTFLIPLQGQPNLQPFKELDILPRKNLGLRDLVWQPRETTAFTIFGLSDAATSAAPPPVLAPKYPIFKCLNFELSSIQSVVFTNLSASN